MSDHERRRTTVSWVFLGPRGWPGVLSGVGVLVLCGISLMQRGLDLSADWAPLVTVFLLVGLAFGITLVVLNLLHLVRTKREPREQRDEDGRRIRPPGDDARS